MILVRGPCSCTHLKVQCLKAPSALGLVTKAAFSCCNDSAASVVGISNLPIVYYPIGISFAIESTAGGRFAGNESDVVK